MKVKRGRPRKRRLSKCRDGTCGVCRSCKTRDCWKRGLYANVAHPTKWLAEEEETLRTVNERGGNAQDVQTALERIGHDRTVGAIRQHASKLLLSFEPQHWSCTRIASFFGVNFRTASQVWLRQGYIKAERKRSGEARYSDWVVQEQAVVDFIRNYPWAYDATRITLPRHPLAALAQQIQARDLWIDVGEAARQLGLSRPRTIVWLHRGALHAERRHYGRGGQHGTLMVRAADIPAAKRYIEARRVAQLANRPVALREGHMKWRQSRNAA